MLRKIKCEESGNSILLLEEENGHAAHSYVTANCWIDPDTIVTARVNGHKDFHCRYVKTCLSTGQETVLFENGQWPNFTVLGSTLYHFTDQQVLATQTDTGKTTVLWTGEPNHKLLGPPALTKDGAYISLSWQYADGSTSIGLLQTAAGTYKEICRPIFPRPFESVTHCMVNPTDADTVFFCHEGDCNYITNRLWLANTRTGEAHNFFHQRLDEEGRNGECCGHEIWSPDGKGMYFIKYISATILPRGVWYIDVKTQQARPIASKFAYWHVGVAPGGIRLAADTQVPGGYSDVIYIDPEHNIETLLARTKTSGMHPCHPHPVFSPDGKKVCFTQLNECGNLCVGISQLP